MERKSQRKAKKNTKTTRRIDIKKTMDSVMIVVKKYHIIQEVDS